MITECQKCGNSEIKLDVEKNEGVCQKCSGVVELSSFMKASMKSSGDIVRGTKDLRIPEGGMKVICGNQKCNKEYSAILKKKDNKAYCPFCGEVAKLSAYAEGLLRENGIYEDSSKVLEAEGKIEIKPEPEELTL